MRDPGIETDLLPHIGQFVCIERSIDRAFDIYIYIYQTTFERKGSIDEVRSRIYSLVQPQSTHEIKGEYID